MNAFTLEQPLQIEGDALFARNRTIRRQLRRWWVERPKRWLAWMMLNPSDASEKKNDPTMGRVIHFGRSWGYDGVIVVNMYPFVASDPREMWFRRAWMNNGPDWYTRDDLNANLNDIERVGRLSCCRIVAFGAAPFVKDQPWLEQCVEAFRQPFDYPDSGREYDERLYCLGHTQNMQPIHPLARGKWRVSNEAKPILWRISEQPE